ncbi:hypothetical protein BDP27DRAFT_1419979 [Rhodocollybia butyracea]|uniref:Uncharacterized protein n=1 Tax=Rhodocollybia butyracea TaxID=206335 RepID=A0A9P5U933_9AGAR|nr:hypothetical protein BDP27DRAFT_1419979 [Rhodocollybia butyracea]
MSSTQSSPAIEKQASAKKDKPGQQKKRKRSNAAEVEDQPDKRSKKTGIKLKVKVPATSGRDKATRVPLDNVTPTNGPVDLNAERERMMKEVEDKLKAMAEQHATHPPVTGTTASLTAESIGQQVQSTPMKPAQWPPVRAHHRAHQEWPPQTETPAATRAPLLTAKDLEGQVTVNNQPVEVIDCPQGEARDGKHGFCLQDAVDLEQNNDEYACFLSRVHSNAVLAHVDLSKTYRQQDPEIISLVCRKTAVDLPYFGKNCFPGYWATREALKQYIKNLRKYQTRLSKAVVSGRKFKNS